MRKINKLVIHCTDSPDSLDIGFNEINDWHRQNGWMSASGVSCGYHYIVRRDGRVELGRPEEEVGAHVKGHNADSLGIVWVGRKNLTIRQDNSLKSLVFSLMTKYDIDILHVVGHNELYSRKTCPNIDMDRFRGDVIFEKELFDFDNMIKPKKEVSYILREGGENE